MEKYTSETKDRQPELLAETQPYRIKKNGEYTLKDYYALPDERRAELIDGVFYDMASPSSAHQIVVGEIFAQLRSYIKEKGGKCRTLISPIDVQLDCDDRTIVQPDVVVVCDPQKVLQQCVYGAPDFVVEILSESTRKKDMILKSGKYKNAGVKEYWIIDAEEKRVLVHDFLHSSSVAVYGMEACVPVGIYGGECMIDFAEVCRELDAWPGQEFETKGGEIMSDMSCLFTPIVISDPEKANAFVDAWMENLDQRARGEFPKKKPVEKGYLVTDPEEVKRVAKLWKKQIEEDLNDKKI